VHGQPCAACNKLRRHPSNRNVLDATWLRVVLDHSHVLVAETPSLKMPRDGADDPRWQQNEPGSVTNRHWIANWISRCGAAGSTTRKKGRKYTDCPTIRGWHVTTLVIAPCLASAAGCRFRSERMNADFPDERDFDRRFSQSFDTVWISLNPRIDSVWDECRMAAGKLIRQQRLADCRWPGVHRLEPPQ